MIDINSLLPELQSLAKQLTEDMLQRVENDTEINSGLQSAYTQIEKGGRTAQAYELWRKDYLEQTGVAWVLSCVFVRFLEDNGLIDECYLAGEGDRRTKAENEHELYFRQHPHHSDREYFEHLFREVGKIPACVDLFAEGKTPLWAVGPSGDGAMHLREFFLELEAETGELRRSFVSSEFDTRFLGDLYQELSVAAQKKYALKQTPEFVEEFILDRTLEPALDSFGLPQLRLIDPTCGSGHFLLGAFQRLFARWMRVVDNETVAAQKALDGVWGVDINPFAVAIARFRLMVGALTACGLRRLASAPGWKIHLAVGDTLLFGNRWTPSGAKRSEQKWFATEENWAPAIYACEDQEAISEVLGQQYHVVVGNPPYITVKDKSLNAAYRKRYRSCHRKYSLAAPFAERFFDLTLDSGYVGTITANSFMKREFGKKLIEQFFPTIDLTHVIDAAGAFIPGHGTPTVILFGRNRKPVQDTVRAALGIAGEPTTPDDPAEGLVWKSITEQLDTMGHQDRFISIVDVQRSIFDSHPWSLGGGGASEFKEELEKSHKKTLGDLAKSVGFGAILGEDEAFTFRSNNPNALPNTDAPMRALVAGEEIRDWWLDWEDSVLFPYSENIELMPVEPYLRHFWPLRTLLWLRNDFSKQSYFEAGRKFWEYHQIPKDKFNTPYFLAFAEVASHNHFILDRGGKLFTQTAPIIKLPDDADEEQYVALLGLLNCSVCGFFLKQVCQQKQMTGGDGVRIQSRAKVPYQFAGTRVKSFPVPDSFSEGPLRQRVTTIARRMEQCVAEYDDASPENAIAEGVSSGAKGVAALHKAFTTQRIALRSQMVFLQEELDYSCYVIYGLADESLLSDSLEWKTGVLDAGMRPFEIRQKANVDDFPVPSTIPTDWPDEVRSLWQRRIDAIEDSKKLMLVEDDHYKRRWIGRQGLFNLTARQDELATACEKWLVERLESILSENTKDSPIPLSTARISELASSDDELVAIATTLKGREDFDLQALIAKLISHEAVPFLPRLVFKASGLEKRAIWERVWEIQRSVDAGEEIDQFAFEPPKYNAVDFIKSDFNRLRGPLDIRRERFISFPHSERDGDPSPVVGWAGWDHVQQATAIVAYYDARKREGWTTERLKPLLAGIDQLLPWIHQWHPEIDPEYNETAGVSFQTLLESEAQELGLTLEDIRNWTPPKKKTTRRKKKS